MKANHTLSMLLLVFTILAILLQPSIQSSDPPTSQYDILQTTFPGQWIPKSLPTRKDLQCMCTPELIIDEYEKELESCCVCSAHPIWAGKEDRESLSLEFVSVNRESVVVYTKPVNMSTVYKIDHSHDELTEFPLNICNWGTTARTRINSLYGPYIEDFHHYWTRIVVMDFSYNKIKSIPDINCMTNLDTLDLTCNKVEHISNTSFTNMPHLRKLLLSSNQIVTMDPTVFTATNSHLWTVDLSNNSMASLDVTNIHTNYPFCLIDYQSNKLQEITNLVGFQLHMNKSYGPGMVSFYGNSFETFPDFKEVFQLEDLSQLGKLIRSGFDFRDTQFTCDCHMELYCEVAADCIQTLWRDYMDVKCASPPHLRGVAIVNVSLDDLVCDLSDDIDCPVDCVCTDQPSLRTVHVNCSNTGKTELPPTVPQSKYSPNINLDMSGNQITVVHVVPYLQNVSKLNLSNNELVGIDEEAAGALENASLDISENKEIRTLPKSLQYRSICSLQMDNLQLTCDCDSSWISSWVSVKGCNNTNSLTCNVPGHGLVPVDEFSTDVLDCEPEQLPLAAISAITGVCIVILGLSGTLLMQFRYEVLILLLRARSVKVSAIVPSFEYDAFLSFDEENVHLRKWTNKILVPYLSLLGYKTYVPCKDLPFGGARANETILTLENTRNFILLLSESYLSQEDRIFTDNEWRYGWNMYKSNRAKKIIIINFDHITCSDVEHLQIKAYLRVGENIDFANHQGNILETIAAKLGPPSVSNMKYIENSNKRFTNKLFQVQIQEKDLLNLEKLDKGHDDCENDHNPGKHPRWMLTSVRHELFTNPEPLVTERQRPTHGQFRYYA